MLSFTLNTRITEQLQLTVVTPSYKPRYFQTYLLDVVNAAIRICCMLRCTMTGDC